MRDLNNGDADTSRVGSPEAMRQELARQVRDRRGELGLSQEALARQGDVSIATLSAVERGSNREYNATTLAGLDRAMQWSKGTSQRILDERVEPTVPMLDTNAIVSGVVGGLTDGLARLVRPPTPSDELVALAMALSADDRRLIIRVMRRLLDNADGG